MYNILQYRMKTCTNKVMLFFLNGEVLTFARINVFDFIRTCLHTRISSSHHMVVLTPDNGCTMECFKVNACVHGYHHYKNAWSAVKGEVLQCVREPRNTTNPCSLFLRKQGTISYTITGSKQYAVKFNLCGI